MMPLCVRSRCCSGLLVHAVQIHAAAVLFSSQGLIWRLFDAAVMSSSVAFMHAVSACYPAQSRCHATLSTSVLRRVCVLQVGAKRTTLLELLSAYRSVPMDLQTLANLLPRLSPR